MLEKVRITSLDGIRAWGMFIIVAGHLHVLGMTNNEQWGNYIFFILSGFVAAAPWNSDGEDKFLSYKYVASFYTRRFMKIMPLLFLSTALMYALNPNINMLDNLMFTNPQGIAWFLLHLMLFYLLLPLIMVIIYALKRFMPVNNIIIGILLIIIGVSLIFNLVWNILLLSNNAVGAFRIGYILVGMGVAYIVKSPLVDKVIQNKYASILFSIGCIGCILISIFFDLTDVFTYTINVMLWVSSLLIFSAYAGQSSFSGKLLSSRVIVLIGDCSFGIMLFHIPLHGLLPLSGVPHFLLVYGSSILLTLALEKVLLRPLNKVTISVTRDMENESGVDFISILVLSIFAVYLFGAYSMAHSKSYSLGNNVHLKADDALGYRYVVRGLSEPALMATWVKDDYVDFQFELEQNAVYDLTATVCLGAVRDDTQTMIIYVDGVEIDTQSVVTDDVIQFSIPKTYAEDQKIALKLHFPDAPSMPASLASIKIAEDTTYELGQELYFSSESQTANGYFLYGLRHAETVATWATDRARMDVLLADVPEGDLLFTLNWAAIDTQAQRMVVTSNGVELFNQSLLSENTANITIPTAVLDGKKLTLEFSFPDACPSSFAFSSICIKPKPMYTLGEQLTFTAKEPNANPFFSFGLGAAEDTATWAKGATQISIPLADLPMGDLAMTLHWIAVDTQVQRMIVNCKGHELFNEIQPPEGETTIEIPFELVNDGLILLDLSFPDACPSSFAFTGLVVNALP